MNHKFTCLSMLIVNFLYSIAQVLLKNAKKCSLCDNVQKIEREREKNEVRQLYVKYVYGLSEESQLKIFIKINLCMF